MYKGTTKQRHKKPKEHKRYKDASKQKHKKRKEHKNANKLMSDFFPIICFLCAQNAAFFVFVCLCAFCAFYACEIFS